MLEVTQLIKGAGGDPSSVRLAVMPLPATHAFQGPQALPRVHANQRAEQIGPRTTRIQTSRQKAAPTVLGIPALNQKVLLLSGPSHSCCSRGAGPPSLPATPTPGPEQVLHWGQTETLFGEALPHPVPAGRAPTPSTRPPPSKLLGAGQLRAASESSCQPSGSVLSARSSTLAPRSRQHDRSEQEFARTGARAQQTRAGPSDGGCRCPVHGADRGSGLPAWPWTGTV